MNADTKLPPPDEPPSDPVRPTPAKPDSVAGEEDPGAAVDAPVKDGQPPGAAAPKR